MFINDIKYEMYFTNTEEVIIILEPTEVNSLSEIKDSLSSLKKKYGNLLISSKGHKEKVTIISANIEVKKVQKDCDEWEILQKEAKNQIQISKFNRKVKDPEIRNSMGLDPEWVDPKWSNLNEPSYFSYDDYYDIDPFEGFGNWGHWDENE